MLPYRQKVCQQVSRWMQTQVLFRAHRRKYLLQVVEYNIIIQLLLPLTRVLEV